MALRASTLRVGVLATSASSEAHTKRAVANDTAEIDE
jgi:hypothetical protein